MNLTGKAKQDFEQFLVEPCPDFEKPHWCLVNRSELAYSFDGSLSQLVYWEKLPEDMQWGVIQSWSDSIKHEILVFFNHHSEKYHFRGSEFDTRKAARIRAVEALDEFYNQNHNQSQ